MSFRYPDRYFKRISDINIKTDILDKGFKNVLLDVDNTILTRDESIVPKDVKAWLKELRSKGVKICLISNDWHANVRDLAIDLDLPIVVRSLKPLPPAFFRALKKIGAKKQNSIMIGDQLMTDVFGSHAVGIKCYMVEPLVEKDLVHTLLLRKIERVLLKGHNPEGQDKANEK